MSEELFLHFYPKAGINHHKKNETGFGSISVMRFWGTTFHASSTKVGQKHALTPFGQSVLPELYAVDFDDNLEHHARQLAVATLATTTNDRLVGVLSLREEDVGEQDIKRVGRKSWWWWCHLEKVMQLFANTMQQSEKNAREAAAAAATLAAQRVMIAAE